MWKILEQMLMQWKLKHYGKQTLTYNSFLTHMLQQVIPHHISKIDRTITNKFQTIIKKCENENVDANLKIRKLGNVFFNAQ